MIEYFSSQYIIHRKEAIAMGLSAGNGVTIAQSYGANDLALE